jgi:hypothetical protein
VVEVSLLDVQLEQCTLGRYFFYPVLWQFFTQIIWVSWLSEMHKKLSENLLGLLMFLFHQEGWSNRWSKVMALLAFAMTTTSSLWVSTNSECWQNIRWCWMALHHSYMCANKWSTGIVYVDIKAIVHIVHWNDIHYVPVWMCVCV